MNRDLRRVRKRIYAGAVCEQLIFSISRTACLWAETKPRIRFKNPAEREQHKLQISRRRHARLVNENMDPSGLYSTLTFDTEYEVHTFEEAKKVRDQYWRRLKYHFPDAVIFLYMGRGKSTDRIHFHMLSKGIPKEVIEEHWIYGSVLRIRNLRAHNYYEGKDCGQDYTGLANYLFDHWTPEIGGHRWKMTKNVRRPHEDPTEEIKREYTTEKPPKAPKGYVLTEARATQYGYLYFKYVKVPQKETRPKRKETGPPPVK